MRTINKVILIGNVTRDPLIKDTEGGKKIAMFTIATNKLIYLEGRLKTRVMEKEWEEHRTYKTEIVASNLIFLNKKSDFDDAGVSTSTDPLDDDDMF